MKRKPLSKAALEDLHNVLRRAAERAESNRRTEDAAKLAQELAAVEIEMSRTW